MVAGAAVAALVQSVADEERAEKKERRGSDDPSSMEQMTSELDGWLEHESTVQKNVPRFCKVRCC